MTKKIAKFSIHSTLTNTGSQRMPRKLFKEMLKAMKKTITIYLQYALNFTMKELIALQLLYTNIPH